MYEFLGKTVNPPPPKVLGDEASCPQVLDTPCSAMEHRQWEVGG